ncbi:hypothetical protein GWI33_015033 [Rhynchophorus ferrugineus]|uniref:Uncharacterized protein n=1 Tax=Rhynchophorus ferrugineus TaxID=354439 RepID=A0A834M8I4_RHYFE|nr:hypothetical protein GWI33_015033 [Rhynchophorus ferrugineus]
MDLNRISICKLPPNCNKTDQYLKKAVEEARFDDQERLVGCAFDKDSLSLPSPTALSGNREIVQKNNVPENCYSSSRPHRAAVVAKEDGRGRGTFNIYVLLIGDVSSWERRRLYWYGGSVPH